MARDMTYALYHGHLRLVGGPPTFRVGPVSVAKLAVGILLLPQGSRGHRPCLWGHTAPGMCSLKKGVTIWPTRSAGTLTSRDMSSSSGRRRSQLSLDGGRSYGARKVEVMAADGGEGRL